MAGYISEFFGYRAEDKSSQAATAAARQVCPFLGTQCTKVLSRDRIISGVCAVRQKTPGSPDVICCPNRIYAEDYKMLHLVAQQAFSCELGLYSGRAAVEKAKAENGAIAVFGHGLFLCFLLSLPTWHYIWKLFSHLLPSSVFDLPNHLFLQPCISLIQFLNPTRFE